MSGCLSSIPARFHAHHGKDYQIRLRRTGVTCSMSRKGDCRDKARAESFFATLKKELIHGRAFRTRAQAKSEIFEFIESWHNRERYYLSLGCISPVEFEAVNNHISTKIAAGLILRKIEGSPVWINDPRNSRILYSESRIARWKAYREHNITIAFPQLDVPFGSPSPFAQG